MAEERLLELPYERIAMAGGEMPEGLSGADQQMFLELRLLYDSHKRGIVDREAAKREKIKLLDKYKANVLMDTFVGSGRNSTQKQNRLDRRTEKTGRWKTQTQLYLLLRACRSHLMRRLCDGQE